MQIKCSVCDIELLASDRIPDYLGDLGNWVCINCGNNTKLRILDADKNYVTPDHRHLKWKKVFQDIHKY